MKNEEKLCPMKFNVNSGMAAPKTYQCLGEQCAWWIRYEQTRYFTPTQNGRCALCSISGNLEAISSNIG